MKDVNSCSWLKWPRTPRRFAAAPNFRSDRSEADMPRASGACRSDENDPKQPQRFTENVGRNDPLLDAEYIRVVRIDPYLDPMMIGGPESLKPGEVSIEGRIGAP